MKNCIHWKELDNDSGEFEYCRGKKSKCSCAGSKKQCDFPKYYNKINLDDVRKEDAIERCLAEVYPFFIYR